MPGPVRLSIEGGRVTSEERLLMDKGRIAPRRLGQPVARRGAVLAAYQRVLGAMEALRDVFPTQPTITVGAARVAAAA
jgi:hypothetical protein